MAKYPGTIQTIEKMSDGSFVMHVVRADNSEIHVRENKQFVVTGIDNGPGGPPPPSGA